MTKDVNVIHLDKADDDDKDFKDFLKTLKKGNEGVVFLITREDGSLSVGSTAKTAKDLLWDLQRLKDFMNSVVRGAVE